jgi:hypothetical protein
MMSESGADAVACADGWMLAPDLTLHHDGAADPVLLCAAGPEGWSVAVGPCGARYLSFALAIAPEAPRPGWRWRAEAEVEVTPAGVPPSLAAAGVPLSLAAAGVPPSLAAAGVPPDSAEALIADIRARAAHGWLRLNAARRLGDPPRSVTRAASFGAGPMARAFTYSSLGVAPNGPPPATLWLDIIVAAPRDVRITLRRARVINHPAPEP